MALERNDVEGAVAAARELQADGKLNPVMLRYLMRLQDDPKELEGRLREIAKPQSPED